MYVKSQKNHEIDQKKHNREMTEKSLCEMVSINRHKNSKNQVTIQNHYSTRYFVLNSYKISRIKGDLI